MPVQEELEEAASLLSSGREEELQDTVTHLQDLLDNKEVLTPPLVVTELYLGSGLRYIESPLIADPVPGSAAGSGAGWQCKECCPGVTPTGGVGLGDL
mmetsp:Transcript_7922/g.22698  ORF Transcript_7922/g.22698 Transcript_7922/m.22698 type:complete len:98 (+) Transcript_7922:1122-1415(+)